MSLGDSGALHARNIDPDLDNVHERDPELDRGGYAPVSRNSLVEQTRPNDNLPFEVLSEIFTRCCPTYKDHYRGPPLSVMILSHVCHLWRHVAFTTPSLWTYVKLEVPYSDPGKTKRAYKLLGLWIERASNCPLLVDVEFVECPQRRRAANVFYDMENLVRVALDCKPSLASEDMELEAALDAKWVPLDLPDDYPPVKEQYTWAKSGIRPDRPLPGSVQIHANRVTEIMYGLEGHSTIGRHMTYLDLRDAEGEIRLSVEECQIALSNFPELTFCALRIGASTDEVAEPIILRKLLTLSLTWSDRVEVGALLDSINAPSLSELELRGPLFPREYYPGNRWTYLSELLRRSAPGLWALTLANMDGTTMELLRCLSLCEGLQHLSLERCRLDEELMDSLQFGEGLVYERARHTILGLDYLGLISCQIFGLNNFLRMSLETQFWEEAELSRLYIINSGFISEDVLTSLREIPLDEFETDPALLEEFE